MSFLGYLWLGGVLDTLHSLLWVVLATAVVRLVLHLSQGLSADYAGASPP